MTGIGPFVTLSPGDCDAVLFDLDGERACGGVEKAVRCVSRAARHRGRQSVRPAPCAQQRLSGVRNGVAEWEAGAKRWRRGEGKGGVVRWCA